MTSDTAEFTGPLIGERYRLGRSLGGGGQGCTYVGLDTRTQRRVAVKELALDKVKDWKQLELFRRESQVLKSLQHAGIPKYVDELTSPDGGRSYLVMELVPGESLRDAVASEGPLDEAQLWRVMWQMTDILAYLHGRNPPVVHRDVKPRNILRRPDGELALVDFGVVQHTPKKEGGETFVGTYGFMAPEQFHGEASPASDIYGLGATLVSLGTGVEPEDLPHEGLRLKFDDKLNVSDELRTLLHDLTEPEPSQRPRNGVELKRQLEARAAIGPLRGEPAPVDGEPILPGNVPPPLAVAMGVLLTLVGVLGTVALTVAHAVIVPLVFTFIVMFSPAEKRPLLRQREQQIRGALRTGVTSFRQLSKGGFQEMERGRRQLEAEPRMKQVRGRRR